MSTAEAKILASEPDMPDSAFVDLEVVEWSVLEEECGGVLAQALRERQVDYAGTQEYDYAIEYEAGALVKFKGFAYVATGKSRRMEPSYASPDWTPAPKFALPGLNEVWRIAVGPLIAIRAARNSIPSHYAQTKGGGLQVDGAGLGGSTRIADLRMRDFDRRAEMFLRRLNSWLGSEPGAEYRTVDPYACGTGAARRRPRVPYIAY